MSLPQQLPKGMEWNQDPETKEWKLVKRAEVNFQDDGEAERPKFEDGVVRHTVLSTDTFQGICLRYKVKPTELRRANRFSGTNLRLAPQVLVIPVDPSSVMPPKVTPDTKMVQISAACPSLSRKEIRAYLELNDWNVKDTISNIKDDLYVEDLNSHNKDLVLKEEDTGGMNPQDDGTSKEPLLEPLLKKK